MKSLEIRKKFFDFFVQHGHEKVTSSSLIPAQDPTILFANAGMNQFKDVFLGKEQRSYTRAVTIQKCVRAGGKHNDLDQVGFTKRHCTFFEMMGNFSFGDYFKQEAIEYAWEFLTKEMHLPVEKLHATVYTTDDESYNIWHKHIGIPTERMHRLGEKDNFWQMGDTGPCGPCTEIHIDRGPEHGCKDIALCGPSCECDRFIEIWNLVFMQYDRQPDGTDKPLKKKGVDTGMGLERLVLISQDKDSIFETDLFAGIMHAIEQLTGKKYATDDYTIKTAFNVVAEHVRAAAMLIADGCAPSNEGRGYVLRKLIRRAALFTQKLTDNNIFPELSKTVIEEFASIYPDLKISQKLIFDVLDSEVKKFSANLVRGKNILERYFEEHTDTKLINGDQAFKLYDTYGFPIELVGLIAQERGFRVDMVGFEQEMQRQQEQSGQHKEDVLEHVQLPESVITEFTGYDELETTSKIIALVHHGKVVDMVPTRQTCFVITQKSPFFIIGGGQVPDQGYLVVEDARIPVTQARFIQKGIALEVTTPITLKVGMTVTAQVDGTLRANTAKNHTATHMLQAALMTVFGKQIKQAGSLVHPEYLRFDFNYHDNPTAEDIKKIEDIVNAKIQEDIKVTTQVTTMKEATSRGVIAFFGEKYNPESVRCVEMPGFSAELCGGTHVHATGTIGVFKITEVTALAAGQRRIVAVTGPKALELFQECFTITKTLGQEFKVKREEIIDGVAKLKEQIKAQQVQIKNLKKQALKGNLMAWEQQVEIVGKVPHLFLHLEGMENEELKEIANHLNTKKPGFYFLISTAPDKNLFVGMLAPSLKSDLNLKAFAAWLKEQGLGGGGSDTVVQGGGTIKDGQTLKKNIREWLENQ